MAHSHLLFLQNSLVLESLSTFFKQTRGKVINLRIIQKKHGTFKPVNRQQEKTNLHKITYLESHGELAL